MKKKMLCFVLGLFLLGTGDLVLAFDEGPVLDVVKKAENEKIKKWAEAPQIVEAVKQANRKADRSLKEIARLDQRWIQTKGVDDWIRGYLDNSCARFLKSLQNSAENKTQMFPEIFVMDRQGCLVCATNKTTDFYQGDENKFLKTFRHGKGAVFIDKPDFDESTRTYSVQVSVPVMDPETHQAIGAMTADVNLDVVGEL